LFFQALSDDLNTPLALMYLQKLAKRAVVAPTSQHLLYFNALHHMGSALGLLNHDPNAWLQPDNSTLTPEEIEEKIENRRQARLEKNFTQADEIRNFLLHHHIVLEDFPSGTQWRRA
jgi:cysteinyl-tRNA synthetase